MNFLVDTLIEWPRSVARHLDWLGPLFARIVVGWVFLWTGWGKLTHLPLVTENFAGWGIPAPGILAPFASGVEFFGGILLLIGLADEDFGGCARRRHDRRSEIGEWEDVDSLQTLLGLEEIMYLALFLWLAIAGAGRVSVDHFLERP